MISLTLYKRLADKTLAIYEHAVRTVVEEKAALETAQENLRIDLECQRIVQLVAQSAQTYAHGQISEVVTHCLKSVFGGEAPEFSIEFLRKRGKTEAKLRFVRDGHACRPIGGSSGGMVAVAAFALRLAVLMLATPKQRRALFLDEPLKDLHGAEYQKKVAELIMSLADKLKVQFIIVTGLPWLRIGKVIDLN
jgi:ABC-type cobalamin/Fe3+-siderophores transport system ATPase subunit